MQQTRNLKPNTTHLKQSFMVIYLHLTESCVSWTCEQNNIIQYFGIILAFKFLKLPAKKSYKHLWFKKQLLIFHLTILDFSPLHFGVQQEVKNWNEVRHIATSSLPLHQNASHILINKTNSIEYCLYFYSISKSNGLVI